MTLLELLFVLVIVGVLAALALPAWRHHVVRVHRTEAMVALYQVLAAEESHHLRHGRYTADLTAPPPEGLGLRDHSEHGRYALRVTLAADGQSFIATAAPGREGTQASDHECLEFSLDHRGRRAVSGRAGPGACWR